MEDQMSDLIDLCQKLVRFKSFSGKTEEIMQFLQQYLIEYGFEARLIPVQNDKGVEVMNLYASYGKGSPHLLFVGHLDVVPAYNEEDWQFLPFEATISDGVLYGRGISDMKGGVACFIEAVKDFVKMQDFEGKVSILLSGDEEEPIVEGTKQVLKQLYYEGERFDFALVGEPSNPLTMGDEIKVGRRGDIVFDITSYGQSGHTAYATTDTNAAHSLVNLIYKLQNDKLDDGNEFFVPSSLHVTTIDVGNFASNVVPNKAFARVDIRFNSNHTYADIENWLNKHIASVNGKFEVKTEYVGEAFLSPINEHIKNLKRVIYEYTNKESVYSTAGGTSDARFVKDYCPVVEYGLTNGAIHKINECETLENIKLLYEIYKSFLRCFF